ncbi:MAG: inositol monophosphatase family protein [Trueperaceae bacterium]|nr:inositol monophosphatase family protein [Trueperaceae bacterium]
MTHASSAPGPVDLDHALRVAIRAADEAGRIQRTHMGGALEIDTKSSATDLVTQVDRACEARIREVIAAAFPDHVVLGEEQGQEGNARCRWIVDPLDGTLNYAHGFPFFCVSVALEVDGRVEIGVVLDPVRDELFQAVRGRGATLNGRPLAVTTEPTLLNAMLATGFAYVEETQHQNLEVFARALPHVRAVRRPGAAALDLCYVAAGRLDGFWELKLNAWDVAAGVLLIREAGGTVTGPDGAPYQLDAAALVASNGSLHARLLGLLDLGTTLAGS